MTDLLRERKFLQNKRTLSPPRSLRGGGGRAIGAAGEDLSHIHAKNLPCRASAAVPSSQRRGKRREAWRGLRGGPSASRGVGDQSQTGSRPSRVLFRRPK